jgi:pSer/pThr/pTyr-binding forkhead associated (FHA) protein
MRASDDTREHAVAGLRAGLVSGRLGLDTFVRRVDDAYDAKTRSELAALTSDLPPQRSWVARLIDRVAPHKNTDQPARILRPPLDGRHTLVIGRGTASDYLVPDPTVSTRHAELRRDGSGWFLHDLGSRNGTRVNGWLVEHTLLDDGDEISLGATTLVFRKP